MKNMYNITSLITEDGFFYCKIKRGMHGLRKKFDLNMTI